MTLLLKLDILYLYTADTYNSDIILPHLNFKGHLHSKTIASQNVLSDA